MASVTLHASGTETSSGTSADIQAPSTTLVGMFVHISAVSGVLPTLVVKLQESPNGGIDWYDVPGIVNGSALTLVSLTNLLPSSTQFIADDIRVVWTIGGVGASFTFEVIVLTT